VTHTQLGCFLIRNREFEILICPCVIYKHKMLEVMNQSDYQPWLVNLCDQKALEEEVVAKPLVQGLADWKVVQILYMMTPSMSTCSQNQ
jgi:hypothetical protein